MDINSDMILLARASRGMTQGELAHKLGVTQGAISKIEHGLTTISEELITQIASITRYPKSFFEQRYRVQGLPISYYRKKSGISKQIEDKVFALTNIRRYHVEQLLRSAELDSKLPEVDIAKYDGDISDIASDVRAYWKLPPGPINDLTKTLEDSGIVIIPCDFGTPRIDGLSQIFADRVPPLIFVNENLPGDRLRFTLAHELGHLILHHQKAVSLERDIETEANYFASEFLMPAKDIRADLYSLGLIKLADLKMQWKVSMQALLVRAQNIGTISDRDARRIWKQISAKGYRKKEPIEIVREDASLWKELIALHLNELNFSDAELSKMLCLNQDEFQEIYSFIKPNLRIVTSN